MNMAIQERFNEVGVNNLAFAVNKKLVNFQVSWLDWFIKKFDKHIKSRFNSIKQKVLSTWKWENLGEAQSDKQIYDWIIWELLFAYVTKSTLVTDTFSDYDVLVDWRIPVDIKTLSTQKTDFNVIKNYDFYLQEKQCKDHVYYVLCYLDRVNNKASFVVNMWLNWFEIKTKYKAQLKNPPYTSTEKIISNHVVSLKDFIR